MNKLTIFISLILTISIVPNEATRRPNLDLTDYFRVAQMSMPTMSVNLAAKQKFNQQIQFRGIGDSQTAQINRDSVIGLKAAKALMDDKNMNVRMLKSYIAPEANCPFRKVPRCDETTPYRRIDGACNNLNYELYGRSNTPYARLLHSEYDDSFEAPRVRGYSDRHLPNPRLVAVNVHFPYTDQPYNYDDNSKLSSFFTFFNQFLTQDLSLAAATSEGYSGNEILGCHCYSKDGECLIIPQPYGDELNADQTCVATPRTAHTFSSFDCSLGKREQLNANTAWLDLSNVYGSNDETAEDLRQFSGGLLRYTEFEDEIGEFLPIFDNLNRFEDGVFKAGDVRVNENTILQSIYTLFLREHNRIARELAKLNGHWNDERLYQEARRINIAKYSHIVFNENAVKLIGEENFLKFIEPLLSYEKSDDYVDVYDPETSPQIYNVFATAAARFGHVLVPSLVKQVDINDKEVRTFTVRDAMKPKFDDFTYDGLRQFILGSLYFGAKVADEHFTSALFDFLEEKPSPEYPSYSEKDYNSDFYRKSLPALNILRGRDHGIPAWHKFRKLADPEFPENPTWDDIDPTISKYPKIFERKTFESLKRIYKDAVDIDVFTGGVSEIIPVVKGTELPMGKTFAYIFTQQLGKIIVSDRFFYSNGEDEYAFSATRFTKNQLAEIRKSTMARLLCDIFKPKYILPNPLNSRVKYEEEGVYCNAIPTVSLGPWKDYNKEKYPADPEPYREYSENKEYSRSYDERRDDYVPSYDERRDDYVPSYDERRDDYVPSYDERRDDYAPSYDERRDDFVPSYDQRRDFAPSYDELRQYTPSYTPREQQYAPLYNDESFRSYPLPYNRF